MKRKDMRRWLTYIIIGLWSIAFTIPSFAGETLGEIISLKDFVKPDGINAIINTEVKGVTDEQGYLVIPTYDKATITEVKVVIGTLKEELVKQTKGDISYYVAQFEEVVSEVVLSIQWHEEGVYEMTSAKIKGSAPGNVKTIKYTMKNTTPIHIGKYQVDFAIPKGYELFSIDKYDPKGGFDIYQEDDYTIGNHEVKKIAPGDQVRLSINISKTATSFKVLMWLMVFVVSAFFLYKNRGMLEEAKKLDLKKKERRG